MIDTEVTSATEAAQPTNEGRTTAQLVGAWLRLWNGALRREHERANGRPGADERIQRAPRPDKVRHETTMPTIGARRFTGTP